MVLRTAVAAEVVLVKLVKISRRVIPQAMAAMVPNIPLLALQHTMLAVVLVVRQLDQVPQQVDLVAGETLRPQARLIQAVVVGQVKALSLLEQMVAQV